MKRKEFLSVAVAAGAAASLAWAGYCEDRAESAGGGRRQVNAKSGPQPTTGVPERFRDHPAFRPVVDDPALPRVLIIGDSISIGYTEPVRRALAGAANVHRIPDNGGDTAKGLENLAHWLGDAPWDVIHFNWGLHDLKRMREDKLDIQGEQVASLKHYAANLEKLVILLKKTGSKLIWATTTPVPDGAAGRRKGDEVAFNTAAAAIMSRHEIAVDDLYAHALPRLEDIQQPANVHFNAEGYVFLGEKVAAAVRKAIAGEGPDAPSDVE